MNSESKIITAQMCLLGVFRAKSTFDFGPDWGPNLNMHLGSPSPIYDTSDLLPTPHPLWQQMPPICCCGTPPIWQQVGTVATGALGHMPLARRPCGHMPYSIGHMPLDYI